MKPLLLRSSTRKTFSCPVTITFSSAAGFLAAGFFVTGFLATRVFAVFAAPRFWLFATTVRLASVLCGVREVAASTGGATVVRLSKVNAISALTDFDFALALIPTSEEQGPCRDR
jgi:hypothetical protein